VVAAWKKKGKYKAQDTHRFFDMGLIGKESAMKIFVVKFFGGGKEFVVCEDAVRAVELAGEERVKNGQSGRQADACKVKAISQNVVIDTGDQ